MSPLDLKICELLGTSELLGVETVQELWSGCGQVAKVRWGGGLGQAERPAGAPGCAVIKHVKMPAEIDHPRGWNTDRSVRRKARSYAVEACWYAEWSARCSTASRVPRCLGSAAWGDERLLLLEDVDASGFPRRVTRVSPEELDACVRWLAAFHAAFLGEPPTGLWPKGTYWQLGTRPDEWARMPEGRLKRSAKAIDAVLDASRFQTVVHGDAKPANFCFRDREEARGAGVGKRDGRRGRRRGAWALAVDFQYVGGGCGVKDLAYLVGACLEDRRGAHVLAQEDRVLRVYFEALGAGLDRRSVAVDRRGSSKRIGDGCIRTPGRISSVFLSAGARGTGRLDAYSEHNDSVGAGGLWGVRVVQSIM